MASADPAATPAATVTRAQVLAHRLRRHQLDAPSADGTVDLLDLGVQHTGPDGSGWALALRGHDPAEDLALAWTLRGAPHAYRRADLAAVAVATAPYSEADAAKRIFDAAKPLKAAGIAVLDALVEVADHLRDLAAAPIVKGDTSGALRDLLGEPFLRFCRPCGVVHIYELPFRLAALQAGLQLTPDTSPPVLARIADLTPPRFQHLAGEAGPRHDVLRALLRFAGPATMHDVAASLDAPLAVVRANWPADAVVVAVQDDPGSRPRYVLADDLDALTATDRPTSPPLLLGPYDPYLQVRDRELLVADPAGRKALWPVLGRPGAVVADGDVVGTWRPRAASGRLTVRFMPWAPLSAATRRAVEHEAERLAAFRGLRLAAVAEDD